MQLRLATNDTVSGLVCPANGEWVAELAGDRAVFNSASNPASNFAGSYTLAIPHSSNSAASPGGDGYGTVTVTPDGNIRLQGNLADGAILSQAVSVSKDGLWPLYVRAYVGSRTYTNEVNVVMTKKEFKGSIIGWLSFNGNNHAPTGTVSWVKTPLAGDALYPSGFTNCADILSSRYVAPPLSAPALTMNKRMVMTKDGNLNGSFMNHCTPLVTGGFSFSSPNINAQRLKLNPANGLLSGSFLNPITGRRTPVKGVVLQDQNAGCGYFLGTSQSGSILLQAN